MNNQARLRIPIDGDNRKCIFIIAEDDQNFQ